MSIVSVFRPVVAVYYRLNATPEIIREKFPGAMEFVNPSEGSFAALLEGLEGGSGLLIIELAGEPRHVFIQPLRLKDDMVVIEGTKPKVFLFSPKNADEFFSYLAKGELGEIERTLKSYSKGNPLRFVLDFAVISVGSAVSTYFNLGLWATGLIGALMALTVVFIERRLGPKGKRPMIHVLPDKTWKTGLKKAEKKGRVRKVSL